MEIVVSDSSHLSPAVATMKFWNKLFPEAMTLFRAQHKAPKRRSPTDSMLDIRTKRNWSDLYDELLRAKEIYDGRGSSGRVKKVLRVVSDKAKVLRPALKLVPNTEYLSPVVGAVQLVLDAATESSDLRAQVASSIGDDELEQTFGDIETFLSIFPGDQAIEKRALVVVVSVFKAVEDAIGFYLDNIAWRASRALLTGATYQTSLRESLSQIKSASEALIQEAQTSNSKQVREIWTHVRSYSERLIANDNHILRNQDVMMEYQEQVLDGQQHSVSVQNLLVTMFAEYQQVLERQFQAHQQQFAEQNNRIEQLSRQNAHLTAEFTARQIPSPQPSWSLPPQTLHELLAFPDLAGQDMAYIERQAATFPSAHRSKTENLITTPIFRDFITDLSSRVLLVHGDFEGTHYVSALSLFCGTLVRAMRALRVDFYPLVFFCGRHLDEGMSAGEVLVRSLLVQVVRAHHFGPEHSQVPRFDMVHGESTDPFPRSSVLHGESTYQTGQFNFPHNNITHYLNTGGILHPSLPETNTSNLVELCSLFTQLVHHLPAHTTLVCILDGIKYYERPEHAESMALVLASILHLEQDTNLGAVVKIFITSPSATTLARRHAAFQDGGNIISLAGMPELGLDGGKGW